VSVPANPTKRDAEARGRWALAALALGAFAIGTAELMVVGILNLIAKSQHVSTST
jgi:MFS transporter, DHA1 family, inner membrane transport protein